MIKRTEMPPFRKINLHSTFEINTDQGVGKFYVHHAEKSSVNPGGAKVSGIFTSHFTTEPSWGSAVFGGREWGGSFSLEPENKMLLQFDVSVTEDSFWE